MATRKDSKPVIHVPRDILTRLNLGQTFAEYDRILLEPGVFVKTPAVLAAEEDSRAKCFFVGRRGTGKTAIARYLASRRRSCLEIHPEIFATVGELLQPDRLSDPRQAPVRALVACLRRAILDEVLKYNVGKRTLSYDSLTNDFRSERNMIDAYDFDTRAYTFIHDAFSALDTADQKQYLKQINRTKALAQFIEQSLADDLPATHVLIDRLDDSWDGSDTAVVILMALLHACLEIATTSRICRPFVFLRENIFERVKRVDTEFTRLETCVVSLDWTEEQLIEMIERRLQRAMNPKPRLGETWDYIFEKVGDASSRPAVFAFCQRRPRDVIRYCAAAIEAALSRRHNVVQVDDLQDARRQFSLGSLKDLADEYSENYPQIQLVLSRFHGLAPEFTVAAVAMFLQKLLVAPEVQRHCSAWIYRYTAPPLFIELLWSIGFWGITNDGETDYRGFGAIAAAPPPLSNATHVLIHPSFHDALDLQQGKLVGELDPELALQTQGLLIDLPEALDLSTYITALEEIIDRLDTCPHGRDCAADYEDIVGNVIRLCFFRTLVNVQEKVRDYEGRVIRDWIASNVADSGFWEMVRGQYGATQVIWECKNYEHLKAADFQQTAYYMNRKIGRFVVVCFRGDRDELDAYVPHIRRIADSEGGMVLLLTDRDLKVFVRQAIKGKIKEQHIRERYDTIVRAIS